MFPGFGFAGLKKDDILSLTYPQFKNLLKTFKENKKERKDFQGEIPSGNLQSVIDKWREEEKLKDADN